MASMLRAGFLFSVTFLAAQCIQNPTKAPAQRLVWDEKLEARVDRVLDGGVSTSDLATSLVQYFLAVKKNGTLSGIQSPFGNLSGISLSSLRSGEDFVHALGTRPAGISLVNGLQAIKHQSLQSAGLVAALASQSANKTEGFMEQVAAQSASLVAEMRRLEERSRVNFGNSGGYHSFPHVHVASRRIPLHHSMVQVPKNSAFFRDGGGLVGDEMETADPGRLAVTLTGFCLVSLLALVTVSGKGAAGVKLVHSRLCAACPRRSPSALRGHSEVDDQSNGKTLSVWDGTVATFSCIFGTGLLAMPYAFSLAGLVAAPVILFFVCCSAYTAHLMAWAMTANAPEAERRGIKPGMRGWGFLVEVAFGERAKHAIDGFLIVELGGYFLSSIVCTAMNVTALTDDISISTAVCISVVIAYALTFVPARLLTRASVVSNIVFIACCLMFIITGLLLPKRAPASDVKYINPHGLISAAGILVYSPAGHAFYPALMQRMEEPAKFPVCVRRAYVAAAVLYLAVAVPGYCLFGSATQPSAVQNIGADLHLVPIPDLGWMNTLAAAGMVVKMLTLQSLVLVPLSNTVEGALAGRAAGPSPGVAVSPCILIVSAAVAVHFASEMATLLNLIGSVFCMNIAFVVPVICYWKLSTGPLSRLRQISFIALVALGTTFAVTGVVTSL